jgi:hypothetical protein
MRIAVPGGIKSYILDRNAAPIVKWWRALVPGPVSGTMIWSYTVPSQRAFLCSMGSLRCVVDYVGTYPGFVIIEIRFNGIPAIATFTEPRIAGDRDVDTSMIYTAFRGGTVIHSEYMITNNSTDLISSSMLGVEYDI